MPGDKLDGVGNEGTVYWVVTIMLIAVNGNSKTKADVHIIIMQFAGP